MSDEEREVVGRPRRRGLAVLGGTGEIEIGQFVTGFACPSTEAG